METNNSPDMVKFSQVISTIASRASAFRDERKMGEMINAINNLTKYDLKPVADNISNTTVNLIAESGKVRELIEKMKDRM